MEVEFGLIGIPLSVVVIVGELALCLPSKCRGGCAIGFVVILLSEEVIVGVLTLSLIPLV